MAAGRHAGGARARGVGPAHTAVHSGGSGLGRVRASARAAGARARVGRAGGTTGGAGGAESAHGDGGVVMGIRRDANHLVVWSISTLLGEVDEVPGGWQWRC